MFSRLNGAVARAGVGLRAASKSFANSARYASTTTAASELRRSVFAPSKVAVLAGSSVLAASVWLSSSSPTAQCAGVLPPEGLPGTNFERTFIAIKPDGVQRGLIGKIIQRFEDKGLTLVAVKLVQPTQAIAEGHYDDLKTKPFFPKLTRFFSSGPVIAFVWQGKGAIATGRRLLGETDPAKSLPGTIRGDYAIDIGRNIIHGSDSPDSAKHEINFWFKPYELVNWTPANNVWIYE